MRVCGVYHSVVGDEGGGVRGFGSLLRRHASLAVNVPPYRFIMHHFGYPGTRGTYTPVTVPGYSTYVPGYTVRMIPGPPVPW